MQTAPRTRLTVGDVMTPDPVAVASDATFKEIVGILTARRISAVPVVDGENRVLGIVSESDLFLKEAFARGAASNGVDRVRHRPEQSKAAAIDARSAMTSPAITIHREVGLTQAARLMFDRRVKRLPVVDEEARLVGVVTRGDLLAVFRRSDSDIRDEVLDDVIVRTLWMDTERMQVGVEDGVVTLTGETERRSDIPILTRLVQGVEGVIGVRNQLQYRYDDTRAGGGWPAYLKA
jgi:CBS domain-containing protein